MRLHVYCTVHAYRTRRLSYNYKMKKIHKYTNTQIDEYTNKEIKYTNTQVKGKYPVINVVMTLVMTSVKVMT